MVKQTYSEGVCLLDHKIRGNMHFNNEFLIAKTGEYVIIKDVVRHPFSSHGKMFCPEGQG